MKLTPYQKKIIVKMKQENALLVTTEGKNYKAWLETPDREKIMTVRVDTGNILAQNDLIIPLTTQESKRFPEHLFAWKLSIIGKRR